MYFSDIIQKLTDGKWIFDEKIPLIYEIDKNAIAIKFFLDKAKVEYDSDNGSEESNGEFDIHFSDFSKFSFSDKKQKKSDQDEIITSILFDGKKLFENTQTRMAPIVKIFNQLSENFDDDETCSPKYQVKSLIEELSLDEKPAYNPELYKLLLLYKDRMEEALNNDFLKENSKIIVFLEEGSGKITKNMGETIKKNAKDLLKGGIGGLFSKGVEFAMSAGSRVAKSTLSEITDSKGILLLTNKNVILAKQDEINEYDFDDAYEIFSAQADELYAGLVDVYNDEGNKVLDNIDQTKWNSFKTQLRKQKKQAEQIGFESSENDEEDEFAAAEKKIAKLKKMLDGGLISQEDFDSKKKEILAAI